MKIARFFSVIFAVLGVVLMLGTAVVCFAFRNSPAKLTKTPEEAVVCAEQLAQALDAGDLEKAGTLLYGEPDLGLEDVPADGTEDLLWAAWLEGMSCRLDGGLYLKDGEFARNGSVTTLDMASVEENIRSRAKAILEEKVRSATDMDELYDADNQFRKELIDRVMQQAVQEALKQDARYTTREFTVKLIFRDGQWRAVPDQALLAALTDSGL